MSKAFSEKGYINRLAVLGHTIISMVLLLAHTMEFIMKKSGPVNYFVFLVLCLVPLLAEWILNKRNPENRAVQHIMGLCYSTLYIFIIFTTTSDLEFAFALPMYMLAILYMDIKYCLLIGIGGTLANIAYIAYSSVTKTNDMSFTDMEFRIAVMFFTGTFMIMATKAVQLVNDKKMMVIREQTENAEQLTENVLKVSDGMVGEIAEVTEKVSRIGDSMELIHTYMGEVTAGSAETAESVEKQLHKTELIQELVTRVKDSAEGIEQNMQNTTVMVADGKERMKALSEQVEKAMSANEQVLQQMKALGEYTGQMNTIIATITSIANSTGMLALNASIEAARAGESGRGFAVVANQISGLANQTKTATVDITELIHNINDNLAMVEEAINVVTEGNKSNAESTQAAAGNFADIEEGADNVSVRTKELTAIVGELEIANNEIVENIQTISAITEEVTAHATETYNVCESNAELVETTKEAARKLDEEAQRLQNCRESD